MRRWKYISRLPNVSWFRQNKSFAEYQFFFCWRSEFPLTNVSSLLNYFRVHEITQPSKFHKTNFRVLLGIVNSMENTEIHNAE